jgi:hypothetical protein
MRPTQLTSKAVKEWGKDPAVMGAIKRSKYANYADAPLPPAALTSDPVRSTRLATLREVLDTCFPSLHGIEIGTIRDSIRDLISQTESSQ